MRSCARLKPCTIRWRLGSKAAQAEMPGVLRQLGTRLITEDPTVWRDARNAHAVVVYILSGGEIKVARAVLESGKSARPTGGSSKARSLISKATRKRPRAFSTRSTRARSSRGLAAMWRLRRRLFSLRRPRQSDKPFGHGAGLAPGTLVEDAALRREVFLAEEAGDFDKFITMSDQYFRRFRRSVYADSFHRSFAVSLTRISQNGDDQQLAALCDLLNSLSTHEQLHLYLEVAHYSLFSGKVAAAKWAGEKAADFARMKVRLHRATLYDGAASVLTTDYDHGVSQLKAVKTDHLTRDEGVLDEAALNLAEQIRQWPQGPEIKLANAEDGPIDLTPPPKASEDLPSASTTPRIRAIRRWRRRKRRSPTAIHSCRAMRNEHHRRPLEDFVATAVADELSPARWVRVRPTRRPAREKGFERCLSGLAQNSAAGIKTRASRHSHALRSGLRSGDDGSGGQAQDPAAMPIPILSIRTRPS